jgi:putative transposase
MEEGNMYHLLNRGVEKRKIFLNSTDYKRFVHDINDFNSTENVQQSYFRRRIDESSLTDVGRPSEKIVDVMCWALMPNHPHLLVVEKKEGGISNFAKKIFGGYTKYFNEQLKRGGVLFQGKSKKILVQREAHFLYLPFYIHLNPLDLFQPRWKEEGIKDIKGAIKFLEEYRWSNYRDIIGKGNGEFSDVTNKELFFELFQTNKEKYQKDFEEWINDAGYKQDFSEFE